MAQGGGLIDLFSAEGAAALEGLARRPTLYAFDFDGTLAPIVDRHDGAQASESTVARLSALGAMVPTALVTGRSVEDLRRRIDFKPLHLVGNHGAEGVPREAEGDPANAHDAHARHRTVVHAWQSQWASAIAGADWDPGIIVEPKNYSLSVHYRKSIDHDAARRVIATAIGRLDPAPRVIGGKCVFNLLPEGAPDKGSALRSLVAFEHCEAAFFIGDDLTDEAAFIDAPASWITVRVGQSDDSAARYFIADQTDIDRCLEMLIASVGTAVASSRRGHAEPEARPVR